MDGYLLDTNVVSFWFNEQCPERRLVIDRVGSLGPTVPLYVSVITIGEIEYCHRVDSVEVTDRQAEYVAFVEQKLPQKLDVTKHSAIAYGDVRARLFNKYAPRDKRTSGMRPEQLLDPETALGLGIQENDLWIAAQAIERNLILVTNDRMVRIREVAPELRVENWARSVT